MSRCKYVICGSGNSENVIQNLKKQWFKSF